MGLAANSRYSKGKTMTALSYPMLTHDKPTESMHPIPLALVMSPLRPWKSLGKCAQSPLPRTAGPFSACCSSGCPRMFSLQQTSWAPQPQPLPMSLSLSYVWSMGGISKVAKCRVREVGIPHPPPPSPTSPRFHFMDWQGLYPALTAMCGVRGRPLSRFKLLLQSPLLFQAWDL